MRVPVRLSGAVLFLWVGSAAPGWGAVCRPHDELAERIRLRLAQYALASHPTERAVRDSLRLPQSALISVIASESVCKKANAAYQAVLAGTGHGFSGQVHVIQVGTTYAVTDPVYRYGPSEGYHKVVIFDSRWRKLTIFTP